MKVLKAVLGLLGIIGLIVAVVFVVLAFVDNTRLLAAANANKSGNLFADPMPRIYLSVALGALGGLLVGLGIGLPPRTAAAVQRDTLEALDDRRTDVLSPGSAGEPAGDGRPHPERGVPDAPPADRA